ncbi:MAG: Rrf2 family transcriptional regulator [bacterium]|nr:Rrf2 family transcriptional regulator [bacterium]
MKFIKPETDYAFQALVFLARNNKPYTVKDIALKLKLPLIHLRKIFRTLASEEILFLTKGRASKFTLNVAPKTVSMARIFKIFQGEIDLIDCVVEQGRCDNITDCFVREKLQGISSKLEQELEKITLI